ncbi:hypothetical protein B0H17DRAFT_1079068, partial [Mycena rosella]
VQCRRSEHRFLPSVRLPSLFLCHSSVVQRLPGLVLLPRCRASIPDNIRHTFSSHILAMARIHRDFDLEWLTPAMFTSCDPSTLWVWNLAKIFEIVNTPACARDLLIFFGS